MSFCNVCDDAADFLTATLGTSTDVDIQSGGLAALFVAKCDEDVAALGLLLTTWQAAFADPDKYRLFRDCTISGSNTITAPDLQTVGSCATPVAVNRQFDGVATYIFRKDNTPADVYKFWYSLHGKQVWAAFGSCDDNRIYQWRKATVSLTQAVQPESNNELNEYTVTFTYKADDTSFNVIGQTWAISDLVIP